MNTGMKFCVILLFGAAANLGLLAAFNSIVDPYQLLDSKLIKGLNVYKTELFFQLNLTKPHQFYRSQRSNMILGSSRAGRSIKPDSSVLRNDNFYNFATPGSHPYFDLLKLKSSLADRDVKKVIYFADFFSFNAHYKLRPASFAESFANRLSKKPTLLGSTKLLQQTLLDYGAAFWSFSTIRDSVSTIHRQAEASSGSIYYTTLHEDGSWDTDFPTGRNIQQEFARMERSYLRGNWFPNQDPRFSLNESSETISTPFADFRSILELAHKRDIELKIVILPVHARLLENLDYSGLWDHFEAWKRRLVELNEDVSLDSKSVAFELWDFNGYMPFSTEDLTQVGEAGALRWLDDSAHINTEAGNVVLEKISAGSDNEYGARLTSKNIDTWILHQRELRDNYRQTNPEVVKEIKKQVRRFHRKNPVEVIPLEF